MKLNRRFWPDQRDLIRHVWKFKKDADVHGAAVDDFLKQGSYRNM